RALHPALAARKNDAGSPPTSWSSRLAGRRLSPSGRRRGRPSSPARPRRQRHDLAVSEHERRVVRPMRDTTDHDDETVGTVLSQCAILIDAALGVLTAG